MAFEKVEFTFPDEEKDSKVDTEIEIEPSSAKAIEAEVEVESEPEPEKKADDALDIEVVDDTPEADRNRKKSDPPEEVTDEELEAYSDKVRKRIQHFSKGYHDERREKERALRERTELENMTRSLMEENERLKGTVTQSQSTMYEQAKRSVSAELEQAQKEYKDAYEAGNGDALLEAQEKLTTARIRADRLSQIKVPALQAEAGEVQTEQEAPVQQQAPQIDPKVKEWADKNTWFGTDDEMTSFALGYHSKLVKNGIDPSSDEYYEKVNSRMREVFPNNFEDTHTEGTKEEGRKSNVVAAATRTTAPKKVKLTQTQVNLAKRLGLPLETYAKQVATEMGKQNG